MDKESKIVEFNNEATRLMQKSYESMVSAQKNFSDLAVSRAIEIAKDNNINLEQSQILGVSFAYDYALVAILYKPIIVGPEDNGEPRQIQVPVPCECLWPQDQSWKDIYNQKLKESQDAVKNAKETGEISKALNGQMDN
jgi:hypothetical protein